MKQSRFSWKPGRLTNLEVRNDHYFWKVLLSFCLGSKPYKLWKLPFDDVALCPITALTSWIRAAGLTHPSGYIFRSPVRRGKGPVAEHNDTPIVGIILGSDEFYRANYVF